MTKLSFSKCLLAMLSVFAFAGCEGERNPFYTGYGDLEIELSADTVISNVAGAHPLAIGMPDVSRFKLSLQSRKEDYAKEWQAFSEFESDRRLFPVGAYDVAAQSFEDDMEGTDFIPFAGSAQVLLSDNATTTAELRCAVPTTLVTVSYSQAFESYFTYYSVRLKSEVGRYVEIPSDGTHVASIRPGRVDIELSLTRSDGRSVSVNPAEIANARAGEHYELRLDVESGTTPMLRMIYDEATLKTPLLIPLDDRLFDGKNPEIKTSGFSSGKENILVEHTSGAGATKCTIKSPGGLKSLKLTIIPSDNGEPYENELIGTDATALANKGIHVTGNVKDSQTAEVDFSGVLPLLSAAQSGDDAIYRFILQAKDRFGRVAETPAMLVVRSKPVALSIERPNPIDMDATEATLTIAYNGTDFSENVEIRKSDEDGVWEKVAPKSVKEEKGRTVVVIPVTAGGKSQKFMAVYRNGWRKSAAVEIVRNVPAYTVSSGSNNVWSSKVDLYVESRSLAEVVPYLDVLVKSDKGEWHPAVTERDVATGRITVSTLIPSTSYTISVGSGSGSPTLLKVHTESAVQLTNNSFEDRQRTIDIKTIYCGGKYSNLVSWMPLYNTATIRVDEPKSWASVNAKTCSEYARTANTWFKVPSTESIEGGYEGAYAVKLRNAAWDPEGVEPPRDVRTDREYYSSKAPDIKYRAAGKLFLGSYSYDKSGRETYNEGIPFTSRPTAVMGSYSYVQDPHDTAERGMVHIRILSGSSVIGEGIGYLPPSTSFRTFRVEVNYTVRDRRATELQLMISSSNYASYSIEEESSRIKTTNYLQRGVSTGAELIIDNIGLLYE